MNVENISDNIFRIYRRETKNLTRKHISNTNTLDFERAFLLIHICRYLYFITFYLKNGCFCPPKCPRNTKGTKNKPLECLGDKRGTKLIIYKISSREL